MKFQRYGDMSVIKAELLDVLLENEIQNNLIISIITGSRDMYTPKWLLSAIKDDTGRVLLTAVCTPPLNLLLYETGNRQDDAAVALLADELKGIGYSLRGVLAERGLAHRFAQLYAGENGYYRHSSMNIMRLDEVADIKKAPGCKRTLQERDMFFAPYWEREFSIDCNVEVFSVEENVKRLGTRIGKDIHFIWEDGMPVSQAVHGRSTPNGAVINGVYTPPHYRGRGYATSVVAELSNTLLERGNSFCCLFADAENPVSCGIYRKIGYYDICVADDLRFH